MGNVEGIENVGGLIGINEETLSDCYATGTVDGNDYTGGLIGKNQMSIDKCFASGQVNGNNCTGGLIGENRGVVSNSYSTGNVDGNSITGGLIGKQAVPILNCYATGIVTGDPNGYTGGLLGQFSGLPEYCANCFWNITLNPSLTDFGHGVLQIPPPPEPILHKTTSEMKQQATFTDWDFVSESANGTDNHWRMCVDGVDYPKLAWQSITADLACGDGVDFIDFAFFASRWLEIDCDTTNNCGGADLDFSTDIDLPDLQIFTENWLQE